MLKLVNNYTYRFHNPKKVFCITDNNIISTQQKTYFTVPYVSQKQSQTDSIDMNVLLAYVDRDMCSDHIRELRKCTNNMNIVPFKTDLSDLRVLSKQMGLPVVVILNKNKKTGQYEIYLDYMRYEEEKMPYYD